MAEPLIPIQTVRYKTYVKEALVEALRNVFASHPDAILRRTKVGIEFSFEEVNYPAVIIRFYERTIRNAGLDHHEFVPLLDELGDPTNTFIKVQHRFYDGDIEFVVYALSSYDRDLIADSLVQILGMAPMESYTNEFLERIYDADPVAERASLTHFININTDLISGFGEQQIPAPWQPEDVLLYQTSYRLGIFGEFYSRLPEFRTYGLVDTIEVYPWYDSSGQILPGTEEPEEDEPAVPVKVRVYPSVSSTGTEPNPNWAGPDEIQIGHWDTATGTFVPSSDDEADPAPWTQT